MTFTETRKKIHFSPFFAYDVPEKSVKMTATIKNGVIRFPKPVTTELQMSGKFIKFYYDQAKKIVGFKLRDTVNIEEMKGPGRWKLIKVNITSHNYAISIKKLLYTQFGEKYAEREYKKLELQRYREMSDVMSKGDVFYFVELV